MCSTSSATRPTEMTSPSRTVRSAGGDFAAPNILIKQGKYDEALAEIKKFDPMPTSGVYKIQALEIYGDIYAGQGKKDEAKAKYLEALKDPGLSKGGADKINAKIGALAGQ